MKLRTTRCARAHRRGGVALLCALPFVASTPASAQRLIPALDLGGAQVTYADSIRASAATIAPSLRYESDHVTIGAQGSWSQMVSGWSSQGGLQLTLFTPPAGLLVGELAALTGGSAHEDGARTGQSLAVARGHAMGTTQGAWVGAGGGAAWDGLGWRGIQLAELGGWARRGPATLLASVTPRKVADSLRYTDVEGAVRILFAPVEIGLAAGFRSGSALVTGTRDARAWGSIAATSWLTPRLAIVASGGAYPVDYTHNFPGGQFLSLALRIGTRPAPLQAPASASSAEAPAAVRVGEEVAGRRTISVLAPEARSVELMGDFTGWTPVPLTRAQGGWWTSTLPIGRGAHEVNVRYDGGPWQVPPGLTAIPDEFGGRAGLLIVR